MRGRRSGVTKSNGGVAAKKHPWAPATGVLQPRVRTVERSSLLVPEHPHIFLHPHSLVRPFQRVFSLLPERPRGSTAFRDLSSLKPSLPGLCSDSLMSASGSLRVTIHRQSYASCASIISP